MKYYLSGPMSGIKLHNYPAFHNAAAKIRARGHECVSPAEMDEDTSKDWHVYLRADLKALVDCEAVAVLPGWEKSKGARLECYVAEQLGMPIVDADTLEPLPSETILQEAQRLVHGDRGADYGHPLDDYVLTGHLMGGVLHEWAKKAAQSAVPIAVPPELATLCMVQVKVSRESRKHKRDNCTDMAGYAECTDMIHNERQRRGL